MEAISALIGVIGALAGVFMGYFLERWSKKGKLEFYTLQVNCSYSTYSSDGTHILLGATKINQGFLHIGVYNSSGDTEIIRNVQLVGILNDKGHRFDTRSIKSLNVPAKEQIETSYAISPLSDQGVYSLIDFTLLDDIRFEFSYINRKGKIVTFNIKPIGLSEIIAPKAV